MIQDHITIKKRHQNFVRKVCETNIVYALKDDTGYATSYSDEMEDENGEPIEIICFWSDQSIAKSCLENEWKDYNITELKLAEFLEIWCVGMNNDGLIVGTNFDKNLFGFEAEPLELILEIIEELKQIGKSLDLKKFNNIEDLEIQVKEILEN